jgi:exonuclease SbcC
VARLKDKTAKKAVSDQAVIVLTDDLSKKKETLGTWQEEQKKLDPLKQKVSRIESGIQNYSGHSLSKARLESESVKLNVSDSEYNGLFERKNLKNDSKKPYIEFVNSHPNVKTDHQDVLQKLDVIRKEHDRAKVLVKDVAAYFNGLRKLEKTRVGRIDANSRRSDASRALTEAENAYYSAQAGILAGKLEAGSPCPVCGSVHHPNKAVLPDDAPTEDELNALRSRKTESEEYLTTVSSSYSALEAESRANANRILELLNEVHCDLENINDENDTTATLEKRISDLTNEFGALSSRSSELDALCKEYDRNSTALVELDNEVNTISERLEVLYPLITSGRETVGSLRAKVEELSKNLEYPSEEEALRAMAESSAEIKKITEGLEKATSEYNSAESALSNEKRASADLSKDIETITAETEDRRAVFDLSIKENGFADENEYRSALAEKDVLEPLRKEVTEFDNSYRDANTTAANLSKELEGKERPDLDDILKKEAEALKLKNTVDTDLAVVHARLERNKTLRAKISSRFADLDSAEKEYSEIKILSDTANGQLTGKTKIAFEQYVQRTYFDRVVSSANRRLDIMSNGRFALLRKKDADNLRSSFALDLEVLDNHSGKSRTVRSLSGGESFKASLSLALGLSDVIQSIAGGIKIETLFIDEGFGTLDAESLNQAVSVLTQLTDGDTLVGIISHVDQLKERINRKIIVTHDDVGRSGSTVRIEVD